jgi:inorganic phosphate transporter, PiT family
MLTHLDPASALAAALLIFSLLMVVMFEATNGFHDAANAVATVIYTKSLGPAQAVVLSGVLNFAGVLIGGIAVAYALVELIPAEVLSPPDGGPAVAMLVALFVAALFWNIGTWWLALPNSSSHCLIGALIGVALGNAFVRSRSLTEGVHWAQLLKVLEALALSPILGFLLAGALYLVCRKTLRDPNLYRPAGENVPVWWLRGVLIFTCSAVSFAHGTNDGQKSIGLIMLTVIGLFPGTYALNPVSTSALDQLPALVREARPLVAAQGDDEKQVALDAAAKVEATPPGTAANSTNADSRRRNELRDGIYRIISQLEHVQDSKAASPSEKADAHRLAKQLGSYVEYAPLWVRLLSAFCLGVGTMIGYKRIVTTLGERLGNVHLTPAQGASAELISALLIGTAGFTGLPVSTTHIVTSGIGGTMVSSGAGLRYGMVSRVVVAWVLTLPVTIVVSAGLYYLLASPRF